MFQSWVAAASLLQYVCSLASTASVLFYLLTFHLSSLFTVQASRIWCYSRSLLIFFMYLCFPHLFQPFLFPLRTNNWPTDLKVVHSECATKKRHHHWWRILLTGLLSIFGDAGNTRFLKREMNRKWVASRNLPISTQRSDGVKSIVRAREKWSMYRLTSMI